ncbi:MAG TPA: trehalase family glycosidase [Terriglobales bacterium]|nr:trehalase family glycosidase [Terriglobales bacterium]
MTTTKLSPQPRGCLLVLLVFTACAAAAQEQPTAAAGLAPIRQYIAAGWDNLTRSMTDCASLVDPKMKVNPVLYVPSGFSVPPAVGKLHADCNVEIEHLHEPIHQLGEIDTSTFHPHGLLYLPNKYVVPGGRFNEMYGWDSYFIIVGLLRDGRSDLARGMVENFFFEIENYGALLNANRTYYLTRSQPPFLSSMVLGVYEAEKEAGHADQAWLVRAYPYLEKDYSMWTREPHLAGSTGLARYFDFGDGPPPEGLQDEGGFYRKVVSHFMVHPEQADHYLMEQEKAKAPTGSGSSYAITVCDVPTTKATPECEPQRVVRLSADYYKGDRSMRESGFDVSFRFGAYGAATHHYAPACLNSLLYKTEKDMERISDLLEKHSEAKTWRERAEARKQSIEKYLWDGERGFFFDYDFTEGKQSTYRFLTTYYPLWAGLATPEQAKAVVKNLSVFEQPGGLAMSPENSGTQWDYPYGWAPVQMLAIQGIRRYGFNDDADRLSSKFLSTVLENFARDGTIREKYNVVTGSSESHVEVGYQANVIGFGWTNAAFLELLHALPEAAVEALEKNAPRFPARAN